MKHFVRISLIFLLLPGYMFTGLTGDFDPGTLRKQSPWMAVIIGIYWLMLFAGAALIIAAYTGK